MKSEWIRAVEYVSDVAAPGTIIGRWSDAVIVASSMGRSRPRAHLYGCPAATTQVVSDALAFGYNELARLDGLDPMNWKLGMRYSVGARANVSGSLPTLGRRRCP
jgi:hypothetical protein